MDLETIKKFGYNITEGKTIFKEGDPADKLFFILDGEVDIYIKVRNAQKKVATLAKGDIFGEMAVVDGKPRSATAVAKTTVKALAITLEQFESIIKTNPEFSIRMIKLLSGKLREANDQISELLVKDKKKILATELVKFSKEYGQKTFKGAKIHIQQFIDAANNYLGMEKESIRQTILLLIKEKYLEYAVTSKDEVILLEKLQTLAL